MPGLTSPIVYIRSLLCISMGSRVFIRDKGAGQSREYGLKGEVEKTSILSSPASPFLACNWLVVCQSLQRPTHRGGKSRTERGQKRVEESGRRAK